MLQRKFSSLLEVMFWYLTTTGLASANHRLSQCNKRVPIFLQSVFRCLSNRDSAKSRGTSNVNWAKQVIFAGVSLPKLPVDNNQLLHPIFAYCYQPSFFLSFHLRFSIEYNECVYQSLIIAPDKHYCVTIKIYAIYYFLYHYLIESM